MRLKQKCCMATLLMMIGLGCRKQSLSLEEQSLRLVYPSVFAERTDLSHLPFRYLVANYPGQPTKSVIISWGAISGLGLEKIAELAVLENNGGQLALLARLPIGATDWPGDGEISDVQLSTETYKINSQTSAFAVRIIRKAAELQPALHIESLALYQLRDKSLNRIFYGVAAFYENDASDPKAVRAVLKVVEAQTSGFSDVVMSDDHGGSTHFQWNGMDYRPSPSISSQKQRIRLLSVRQVLGSGPDLDVSGKGSAMINDGSAAYMWGSTTPPDVEITLSVTDAVLPSLCFKLVSSGIPAGKAIELNGMGTFENKGSDANLSAEFNLSSLSSCEWVKL